MDADIGDVRASEWRDPRFTELDAQIQDEAEQRQQPPQRKQKPRSRPRSTPPLPALVRKEIRRAARELNRHARSYFIADPKLKDRAARLLRSLLLPKPRRCGRPGIECVTKAIALRKRYRRSYPGERPAQIWRRIYPEVIPDYGAMSETEQGDARHVLRERVRWRLRERRHRNRL